MFQIGICDDNAEERKQLRKYCENLFINRGIDCNFFEYNSAETLLEHLLDNSHISIELLFLDIEMSGMNGLRLRDQLIKMNQVWRIIFVSSHVENIMEAFGLKTVGFLQKPVEKNMVEQKIDLVFQEYREKIIVELPSSKGPRTPFRLEYILFFEAAGNYTKIFFYSEDGEVNTDLISCQLKEVEERCNYDNIIRIHKSFCVNLGHISNVYASTVNLETGIQLPVGRKFWNDVRAIYGDYILKKAREMF